MKRFLTAILACLIISAAFAGCYDPAADPNMKLENGTIAATEATTEAATEAASVSADYKNNLAGLRDYLKDLGYIKIEDKNANVTEMKAELIGAEKGRKYTDGDIMVEIYEFDLKSTDKTRDEVIASVKKNGTFTLYDNEIPAYLSDNGKFLLIYTNSSIGTDDTSSDAYNTMQNAIKAFKSFNA